MKTGKAWTAIERLLIIWKSDISDEKQEFLQAIAVLVLLHCCTTSTLILREEN